jgi:Mg/Co/Ni transporter MgtE
MHDAYMPRSRMEDEKKDRAEQIAADWDGVVDRWQRIKRETELELNVMERSATSPSKNRRVSTKQEAVTASPAVSPQKIGSSSYMWASSSPQQGHTRRNKTAESSSSPAVSQPTEQLSMREAKSSVVHGLVAQIASGQKLQGKSLPEIVAARMIELKYARKKKKKNELDDHAQAGKAVQKNQNNSTMTSNNGAMDYSNTTDMDLTSSSIVDSGSFEASRFRGIGGDSDDSDTESSIGSSSFHRRDYALSQPRPQPRLGFRSINTSINTTNASIPQARIMASTKEAPSTSHHHHHQLHAGGDSPDTSIQSINNDNNNNTGPRTWPNNNGTATRSPPVAISPSDSIFSPVISTCRYCAFQGPKDQVLSLGMHHSANCIRFLSPKQLKPATRKPSPSKTRAAYTPPAFADAAQNKDTMNLSHVNIMNDSVTSVARSARRVSDSPAQTWPRLTETQRAEMLATMSAEQRAEAFSFHPRKELALAYATLVGMGRGRQHAIMDLTALQRAELLCALPMDRAARLMADMPFQGRVQCLGKLAPCDVWDYLSAMSMEERAKCLKSLDMQAQGAVFRELTVQDRAAILVLTQARDRGVLLDCLTDGDKTETLMAMSVRDCVTTLRHVAPEELEAVLIRIPSEFRDKVIAGLPPKETAQFFASLPLESVSAIMEGVTPHTLAYALRSLGSEELALVLSDMPAEEAAAALAELTPRDRAAVLAALQPRVCASVVTRMRPRDACAVLKTLPLEMVLSALREMSALEQKQVCLFVCVCVCVFDAQCVPKKMCV